MIGGVKVVDAMLMTKGLSMFVCMRLAIVMRGLRLEESVDGFEGFREAECSLCTSFTIQFLLGSWAGGKETLRHKSFQSLFSESFSFPNTSELLLWEGEGQLDHFFTWEEDVSRRKILDLVLSVRSNFLSTPAHTSIYLENFCKSQSCIRKDFYI